MWPPLLPARQHLNLRPRMAQQQLDQLQRRITRRTQYSNSYCFHNCSTTETSPARFAIICKLCFSITILPTEFCRDITKVSHSLALQTPPTSCSLPPKPAAPQSQNAAPKTASRAFRSHDVRALP